MRFHPVQTKIVAGNGYEGGEKHWRIRLAWWLRHLADAIEGRGRRSWAIGLYGGTSISDNEKQEIIRHGLRHAYSLFHEVSLANAADLAARQVLPDPAE